MDGVLSCYMCTAYVHFFFFNDTATTEIYTLSLHDALPISECMYSATTLPRSLDANSGRRGRARSAIGVAIRSGRRVGPNGGDRKSTRLIQSRQYLVCRLLLEKKKKYSCAQQREARNAQVCR